MNTNIDFSSHQMPTANAESPIKMNKFSNFEKCNVVLLFLINTK